MEESGLVSSCSSFLHDHIHIGNLIAEVNKFECYQNAGGCDMFGGKKQSWGKDRW